MTQGKITVESLWGHAAFYTFTCHLLPPSVKGRGSKPGHLWLKSVWPLWFASFYSPLVSKVQHNSCVLCSLQTVQLLCWSAGMKKRYFDYLHQWGRILACKISRRKLIYMQYTSSRALSRCYLSSTENRVFSKYRKFLKHHCVGTAGKTIILARFLSPQTLFQQGTIRGRAVPSAQLFYRTSASSCPLPAAAWSDSEAPEKDAF